ncbi:hydroxyacylglutathione hydrolase [Paracoccus sp. MC1854]|uniref:hydroxyacylglutathione hydrolase n=1 Tax=Paracoccus sp. MC1854 TaxID=2760306 RepID=UPI0016009BCA|nr:hydroxyacylglutathione hydrolase [Paracoccus sp. MC1854]
MMAELVTIHCLSDNYAYLVHDLGCTLLVDAPEAGPILSELDRRGWGLDAVLLTHHHDDHIQAVPEIVAATGAQVWGNAEDTGRLPPLDRALETGDWIEACGQPVHVIDVPGHTVGHVAFHLPNAGMVFTADSLMAMGCGRLFEGTAAQMWASLSKLAELPDETLVCSGHDYARGNGAFALSVDPDNRALKDRLDATLAGKRPASPATLAEEKATNPFLRAAELARAGESPMESFARLRAAKDSFRG